MMICQKIFIHTNWEEMIAMMCLNTLKPLKEMKEDYLEDQVDVIDKYLSFIRTTR